MYKNNLTEAQIRVYRNDSRNSDYPFKIVASGHDQPIRFATEKNALAFFDKHKGRCLLSYNTNYSVKFLAYKFS